jgi:long-chain acyl-CoA synthetase
MAGAVPRTFAEVTTLGDLSRFNAAVRPAAAALIFEERVTSYRELDLLANRIANGLLAEGIRPGAHVGFLGLNSDNFFQLVFGCAKANAVIVGINWRLAAAEVANILTDAEIEVLVIGEKFQGLVGELRVLAPSLRRTLIIDSAAGPSQFESWRDSFDSRDPWIEVTQNDVAIVMYTSGTTGIPKGVQLPHRAFFDMLRHPANDDMAFQQWTEHDVSLVAMPTYHIGGVGWGIIGLRAGAKNVVLREFDPARVVDALEQHGVSRLFLVPTAMRMVLAQPRAQRLDYESLDYIVYGASPIPLELLREALSVFRCGFVQFYGMTETTGGATYLPAQDHDVAGNERMRSAGKPLPGVRVKVIDADGKELPPGAMGEICIDSPANMVGYWHRPDATAQTLIDGYVHTGDAGYVDDDGYVYVLDRAKDMIVSGGENISPAEVESAIFGHPAVADIAVIGVPDERWGEAVRGIVVLKQDAACSAAELIDFARRRIAGYKLPKAIDFVTELPRNASGKVLKRELRKSYWAGTGRRI